MPTVQFGSRGDARQVRQDRLLSQFVADDDDARSRTVTLDPAVPESALQRITGMAADSRRETAEAAGQAGLTRHERQQIDFSAGRANVPHGRSVKAVAQAEGVDDWLAYYDPELTVDEHREVMQRAGREDRGAAGIGRGRDRQRVSRHARAFDRQREQEVEHAKDPAFEGDEEAQEFLRQRRKAGDDVFDIHIRETNGYEGAGRDFERLEEIHGQRSPRAQAIDEAREAPITRDPFEWVNQPDQVDFPGIDTADQGNSANNSPVQARNGNNPTNSRRGGSGALFGGYSFSPPAFGRSSTARGAEAEEEPTEASAREFDMPEWGNGDSSGTFSLPDFGGANGQPPWRR